MEDPGHDKRWRDGFRRAVAGARCQRARARSPWPNEAFYILNGTFRFKVGDDVAEGSVGTFAFIPSSGRLRGRYPASRTGRVLIHAGPGGRAEPELAGL